MDKEKNVSEIVNSELELISRKISEATNPEDIFGQLSGEDKIKLGRSLFYHLSKKVHPDAYQNSPYENLANSTFTKLHLFWRTAEEKIKAGTYGTVNPDSSTFAEPLVIKTKKREYKVSDLISQKEISNLYGCSFKEGTQEVSGVCKITRDSSDNDLLENEVRILEHLRKGREYGKFHKYLPDLVDSFSFINQSDSISRQVNIFRVEEELFSLQEVLSSYPGGIHPKDMAWIWRRLLVGLGFAHNNKVIHDAVLLTNVFIQPEKHGLVIDEWSYAVLDPVRSGEKISAICSDYESWYPQEVFNKEIPTPGLDILMGARCMIHILGGDPISGVLPNTIDNKLRSFFKECFTSKPSHRPQDAWGLLFEFDQLIADLWGPRTFRPFTMPKRNNHNFFR